MSDSTIEQKAASAILELPIAKVTLGGDTYEVAPPSTATLIMVSSLISELPEVSPDTTDSEVLPTILGIAKDSGVLGRIAATLILGARRIKEHPMTTVEAWVTARKWSWRHFRKVEKDSTVSTAVFERDHLAGIILEEMTPAGLHDFLMTVLTEAHLADFFVLTTSLQTKNLLKARREVETTTAPGLS